MRKVIVAGADSHVGSTFARLSLRSFQIVPTTRDGHSGSLKLDLLAPEQFPYSILSPGDSVLFCAGISSPDACGQNPELAHRVNVVGSLHFLTKAQERGARVIFLSSDTVLGPTSVPTDETAVPQPLGAYSTMKREVESQLAGSPLAKIIRLSLVISLQDKFTRYLLECIETKQPIRLLHPICRNAIHMFDVVRLARRLLEDWEANPVAIVHGCGPRCLSRLDIAHALFGAMGYAGDFVVERPSAEFYRHRPESIILASRHLAGILGRPPLDISDGYRAELRPEMGAGILDPARALT